MYTLCFLFFLFCCCRQRSADFFDIAGYLRRLSDSFGIPILVINQVKDRFMHVDSHLGSSGETGWSASSDMLPSTQMRQAVRHEKGPAGGGTTDAVAGGSEASLPRTGGMSSGDGTRRFPPGFDRSYLERWSVFSNGRCVR